MIQNEPIRLENQTSQTTAYRIFCPILVPDSNDYFAFKPEKSARNRSIQISKRKSNPTIVFNAASCIGAFEVFKSLVSHIKQLQSKRYYIRDDTKENHGLFEI